MSSPFDPFHVTLLVRVRPCQRTELTYLEWSRALSDDRVDRNNAGGLRLYERLRLSRVRPENVKERTLLAGGRLDVGTLGPSPAAA